MPGVVAGKPRHELLHGGRRLAASFVLVQSILQQREHLAGALLSCVDNYVRLQLSVFLVNVEPEGKNALIRRRIDGSALGFTKIMNKQTDMVR